MNSVTDVQQAARDGFYGKGVQTTVQRAEKAFDEFVDGRESALSKEELEAFKTAFVAGFCAGSSG